MHVYHFKYKMEQNGGIKACIGFKLYKSDDSGGSRESQNKL